MENKIRFRNHFSMALPNLKGVVWIFLMALFSGVLGDDAGAVEDMIITITIVMVVIIAFMVWQFVIWAKTWITISEQDIVIECNTFFSKKKNTISLKSISNINLEQSLVCMLFGTCKLKLDTNSLSTANVTDVTIVLKKRDAEDLRMFLTGFVTGGSIEFDGEPVENVQHSMMSAESTKGRTSEETIMVKSSDILFHGVLASKFLYTIFVPLYILLEFVTEMSSEDLNYIIDEVGYFAAETIGLWVLILIAFAAWGVLALLFSLVRDAVRYWDFQVRRQEDKLILNYGLTKKINYSIPVGKIQAVIVKQTLLARIFHRYMVEVVNVGMNDDEKETQAFLLPYSNKEFLRERMHRLLPEFADYLDFQVERQPKSVWIVGLYSDIIYLLVVSVILIGMAEWIPEFSGIVLGIVSVLTFALAATKLMGYLTRGTRFNEQILVLTNGTFSRKYVFIKYEKIQYVKLQQNFVAKRFGIQKGVATLLASMKNQIQVMPYFTEEKIQVLKGKL